MPSGTEVPPLEALEALASGVVALVERLEAELDRIRRDGDSGSSTESKINASIDPLALAHDSTALIKAHSTKISLLITNEPFTPTAIGTVLRELASSPLPALVSACEACDAARYTRTYRRALASKSYNVLKELRVLVEKIPTHGGVLTQAQQKEWSSQGDRGSLAITGLVWNACDDVMQTSKSGVPYYFVTKTQELRDTLKDIVEELKDWGDEMGDGDDDEGTLDSDPTLTADAANSPHDQAQVMLDELMNSHQSIPQGDPDKIRERLDSCLRRLRLTTLLYQAIIKRRFRALSKFPDEDRPPIPGVLDEAMDILRKLPDGFGDLAEAFYDLRPGDIDSRMEKCFRDAVGVSELLIRSWEGQRDEFTDWAEKFKKEVSKA